MSRLPIPGSDKGTWGNVLNDFLSQSHAADGSLKSEVVGTDQIASGAVTTDALADGAVSAGKIPDGSIGVAKLQSVGIAHGVAELDADGDVVNANGEKLLDADQANSTFVPIGIVDRTVVVATDPVFGAKGDAIILRDAAIVTGTNVLTSASAAFASSDVGKKILVANALDGTAPLRTTIAGVTSTGRVTLAARAGVTISAARAVYGTNDTAAITAAYAAAVAIGGELRLPAKQYLVDPLVLPGSSGTIRGYGATLLNTMWYSDNTIGIQQYGNNVASIGYTHIVAIPYSTPQAGFGNYDLLRIGGRTSPQTYYTGARVIDVNLDGGTGLMVYRTSNVTVRGCSINNSHGNSLGVVDCVSNVRIVENYCTNGNDDLIAVTADSGTGQPTTGVVVHGNIVDTGDAGGIKVAGADKIIITSNHVKNTYTSAIHVFQDTFYGLQPSHRPVVVGNIVDGGGKCFGTGRLNALAATTPNGIHLASSVQDALVSNNTVLNTQGPGIQVTSAAGLTITGNRIIGSGTNGINVGSSTDTTYLIATDVTIANNVVRSVLGAIVLGSITGVQVTGNQIRSYGAGNTGYRGIQYSYLAKGQITDNVIVNDDRSGATLFDSAPGFSSIRLRGNSRNAPAAWSPIGDLSNSFPMGANAIAYSSAIPTTGYWVQGDRVFNSSSTAGASADWTCSATGIAVSTGWSASTSVATGTQVYSGSNVYICINGGITGSIAVSGTGAAITDGTAIWTYVSARATFASPAAATVAGVVLQRTKAGGYIAPQNGALRSTIQIANNRAFFLPLTVSTAATMASLNVKVTAAGQAGATIQLALYADDGTTNPIGSPLAAGSVTADTTGVKSVAGLSVALAPGIYWIAAVAQNAATTSPTVSSFTGSTFGLPAASDPANVSTCLYADNQPAAFGPPPSLSVYTASCPALTIGT